jgi:hypothetical protein
MKKNCLLFENPIEFENLICKFFGGNLMVKSKENRLSETKMFRVSNLILLLILILISNFFILNANYASAQTNIDRSKAITPDPADDALNGIVAAPSGDLTTGNNLVNDDSGSNSLEGYSVTGGFSATNDRVYNNTLTIKNESSSIGDCSAGCKGSAYGGWSSGGTVDGNTIIIEKNMAQLYVINNVIGGESKGTGVSVSSNTVTVTNIMALGVFGGRNLGSGDVENNNVTIDGGTFIDSSGTSGISSIRGGSTEVGNAKTNHVIIKSESAASILRLALISQVDLPQAVVMQKETLW